MVEVASGTVDVATALHGMLPKQLRMPNGDLITIDWYDGDPTQKLEPRNYPYGIFTRISKTPVGIPRYLSLQEIRLDADPETYTYDADGDQVYPVVQRDIAGPVTGVEGTAGGVDHTFIENTDFEVVSLEGYTTPGAIEWLPGGTLPDDGTDFTIEYQHRMVDFLVVSRSILTYRLTMHCSSLAIGQRGATVAYDRAILADFASDFLDEWLAVRKGSKLAGPNAELIVGEMALSGRLPIDEDETVHRVVTDLRLPRFINGVAFRVPLVGKLEFDPTVVDL